MFDFGARQKVPTATVETLKEEIFGKCNEPCAKVRSRSSDCACYAEFAARYWLRLGSFPVVAVDRTDVRAAYAEPDTADAVDRFLAHPNLARARGWSSVITGPPRSGKTSLATQMAKKVMAWEIAHAYTTATRAVYFTARDYALWLRKVEDFRRSPEDLAYYEGALISSVVVWDDIDPDFANDAKFVADVKQRTAASLSVHLVLSQPAELYQGSLLAQAVGLSVQNGQVRTTANLVLPLVLSGEIMSSMGWS